jgi:hypothetical protein
MNQKVSDTDARNAVRKLLERFDLIAAQGAALAYVLARKGRQEYEQLLEAAEIAQKIVVEPLTARDAKHDQVYQALDDPNADWSKAVVDMLLDQEPIVFTGDEAFRRTQWMITLDERFDEEMRKRKKQNGEGPKE